MLLRQAGEIELFRKVNQVLRALDGYGAAVDRVQHFVSLLLDFWGRSFQAVMLRQDGRNLLRQMLALRLTVLDDVLAPPQPPPARAWVNVAGLLSCSHVLSFRLLLRCFHRAWAARFALALRCFVESLAARARAPFLAISERSAGVNVSARARPPSLPSNLAALLFLLTCTEYADACLAARKELDFGGCAAPPLKPCSQSGVAPQKPRVAPEFHVRDFVLCAGARVFGNPARWDIPAPCEFAAINHLKHEGGCGGAWL